MHILFNVIGTVDFCCHIYVPSVYKVDTGYE